MPDKIGMELGRTQSQDITAYRQFPLAMGAQ